MASFRKLRGQASHGWPSSWQQADLAHRPHPLDRLQPVQHGHGLHRQRQPDPRGQALGQARARGRLPPHDTAVIHVQKADQVEPFRLGALDHAGGGGFQALDNPRGLLPPLLLRHRPRPFAGAPTAGRARLAAARMQCGRCRTSLASGHRAALTVRDALPRRGCRRRRERRATRCSDPRDQAGWSWPSWWCGCPWSSGPSRGPSAGCQQPGWPKFPQHWDRERTFFKLFVSVSRTLVGNGAS